MHLFVLILLLSNIYSSFCLERRSLTGIWSLDAEEDNPKYKNLTAKVPGGIFTDLINNYLIDDPLLEENDQEYKWVGRRNWTYQKNFIVTENFFNYSSMNLIFEGLDTISEIYLNGDLLGKTENMFVRYVFNVKNYLKIGNNSLKVKFASPVYMAEKFASEQNRNYSVPPECPPSVYNGECHVNELRKMQASFSWDWGPSLPSVGIWKDVYLEASNMHAIRYTSVQIMDVKSKDLWNISITTYLGNNLQKEVRGQLIFTLDTDYETKIVISRQIHISVENDGEIAIPESFQIPQNAVKRWWPNRYGEQCLYNLTIKFISGHEEDVHTKRIGFRIVELIQDKIDKYSNGTKGYSGYSFYFKVNDIPIFAKGSNAIPLHILPELGQNKTLVDRMFRTAKDSNMNMMRVWGGGVYESDYYYTRADELGIMIWQDFMFACALYPTGKDFLNNVIAEVSHQVKRLASHPSIVIWAGNNENEAAITGNWYGSKGKQIYNNDYIELYIRTIKSEFQRHLPNGIFLTSSPTNGLKSLEDGGISKNPYDPHYGDVHTYIYELDSFNPNIYPIPRFSSEYGFMSYPSMKTLRESTNSSENLKMGSHFLKHRQHHPLGDIELHLLIFYQLDLPPKKSSNYTQAFIFYSQVIQAVAIKTETEHYRKYRSTLTPDGKGHTMGALYWQMNDVWVAPTWSGVDYFGRWKMLQYFVRDVFAPIITFGHLTPNTDLEITIASDSTTSIEEATLTISLYKWSSFEPISTKRMNVSVESCTSTNILSISTDEYLSRFGCGTIGEARRNCFFHLSLSKADTLISPENVVIPQKLKALNLVMPEINISSIEQIGNDGRNFRIVVRSSSITLFVWLECETIEGQFSTNGFHQLNEFETVHFQSEADITIEDLKKDIKLSHILSVA